MKLHVVFLLLIHSTARPIQVFTRRPGTCGTKYFGCSLIGCAILSALVPLLVNDDYVRTPLIRPACCLVLAVHLVQYIGSCIAKRQGANIGPYDPGVPILCSKANPDPLGYALWQDALAVVAFLPILAITRCDVTDVLFFMYAMFPTAISNVISYGTRRAPMGPSKPPEPTPVTESVTYVSTYDLN